MKLRHYLAVIIVCSIWLLGCYIRSASAPTKLNCSTDVYDHTCTGTQISTTADLVIQSVAASGTVAATGTISSRKTGNPSSTLLSETLTDPTGGTFIFSSSGSDVLGALLAIDSAVNKRVGIALAYDVTTNLPIASWTSYIVMGDGTYSSLIQPNGGAATNTVITLPATSGTLALTSAIVTPTIDQVTTAGASTTNGIDTGPITVTGTITADDTDFASATVNGPLHVTGKLTADGVIDPTRIILHDNSASPTVEITQSGSGYDIQGTSASWYVDKTGNAHAASFTGDGSHLTGISGATPSWDQTLAVSGTATHSAYMSVISATNTLTLHNNVTGKYALKAFYDGAHDSGAAAYFYSNASKSTPRPGVVEIVQGNGAINYGVKVTQEGAGNSSGIFVANTGGTFGVEVQNSSANQAAYFNDTGTGGLLLATDSGANTVHSVDITSDVSTHKNILNLTRSSGQGVPIHTYQNNDYGSTGGESIYAETTNSLNSAPVLYLATNGVGSLLKGHQANAASTANLLSLSSATGTMALVTNLGDLQSVSAAFGGGYSGGSGLDIEADGDVQTTGHIGVGTTVSASYEVSVAATSTVKGMTITQGGSAETLYIRQTNVGSGGTAALDIQMDKAANPMNVLYGSTNGTGYLMYFDGPTYAFKVTNGAAVIATGLSLKTRPVSTSGNASLEDYAILVTTGSVADVTITLPAASTATGKIYNIKKVDSGSKNVIIDGNGAETIDGDTTKTISTQYTNMTIQCDGAAWWVQ